MKIGFLMTVGLLALSASAQASTYNCTASTGGIYSLTLNEGSATLVVDGIAHTGYGAGEYYFSGSFAIGGVVFDDPTLSVPIDGSTADIQFTASLSGTSGGQVSDAQVSLTCSQ